MTESDERLWSVLIHVSALFTWFVAPLIIWLLKRNESPLVDAHGKEVLNFRITMLIGCLVAIGLIFAAGAGLFVLTAATAFPFFILFPFLFVFFLAIVGYDFVCSIIGAVKAGQGALFRYPLTWRLIK